MSIYFKEDQTADVYQNDTFLETTSVTYSDKTISVPSYEITFSVVSDGKELHDASQGIMFKIGNSVFTEGDYTYYFSSLDYYLSAFSERGWIVKVNDTTQSNYGAIRTDKPDGYPLHLFETFYGCTNLTTAPVITSNVVSMCTTFYGCTNLTGNVEIHANTTACASCFLDTEKPITIIGSCSDETKAALAATANNGNVSY